MVDLHAHAVALTTAALIPTWPVHVVYCPIQCPLILLQQAQQNAACGGLYTGMHILSISIAGIGS